MKANKDRTQQFHTNVQPRKTVLLRNAVQIIPSPTPPISLFCMPIGHRRRVKGLSRGLIFMQLAMHICR